MKRFCTVPMCEEDALIYDPDAVLYKYMCGRTAKYKVGDWYVCKRHKEYYTDPNKWPAELLEGEIDDERNESRC